MSDSPRACPTCGARCVVRPASVVYGTSVDCRRLEKRKVLICSRYPACDTYCSARTNGVPIGKPAGRELRLQRMRAHLALDPFWRTGRRTRNDAYIWLAKRLGIPVDECHIGFFDVAECKLVIEICRERRAVA